MLRRGIGPSSLKPCWDTMGVTAVWSSPEPSAVGLLPVVLEEEVFFS